MSDEGKGIVKKGGYVPVKKAGFKEGYAVPKKTTTKKPVAPPKKPKESKGKG